MYSLEESTPSIPSRFSFESGGSLLSFWETLLVAGWRSARAAGAVLAFEKEEEEEKGEVEWQLEVDVGVDWCEEMCCGVLQCEMEDTVLVASAS